MCEGFRRHHYLYVGHHCEDVGMQSEEVGEPSELVWEPDPQGEELCPCALTLSPFGLLPYPSSSGRCSGVTNIAPVGAERQLDFHRSRRVTA
jgi:hypothetical protein